MADYVAIDVDEQNRKMIGMYDRMRVGCIRTHLSCMHNN